MVELAPDESEAYGKRAQVLFELGRFQQASDSVQRFLELSTDLPFDDPNIRKAFELQSRCRAALADEGTPGL